MPYIQYKGNNKIEPNLLAEAPFRRKIFWQKLVCSWRAEVNFTNIYGDCFKKLERFEIENLSDQLASDDCLFRLESHTEKTWIVP